MTQDLGCDLHELLLKSYVVAAVGYSLKSYVAATRERVASFRCCAVLTVCGSATVRLKLWERKTKWPKFKSYFVCKMELKPPKFELEIEKITILQNT